MLNMAFISYDYLTRHIVPGPRSIIYFGPFIVLPLALALPRSVLSRWQSITVFIPLITLCCILAWRDMDGVDVISINGWLWSLFLIALQDPWQDFRLLTTSNQIPKLGTTRRARQTNTSEPSASGKLYKKSRVTAAANGLSTEVVDNAHSKPGLIEQPYPERLGERTIWIFKLLASIRLDNWKIRHESHDRLQPPAAGFSHRAQFLRHSVLCLVRGFLIIDFTRTYIEFDPYFTNLDVSIDSSLPFHTSIPLFAQVFRSMVVGAQAWALIGQMFYLPAAIPVILNVFGVIPDRLSPHTWPSYFGSSKAIFLHGVRGFWGTFWHQTMRWTTSGPGYALANVLGLPHKGLLRYACLSISAFGFSGIVHMGLVPPEPLGTTYNVNSIRLFMAGFFWLQAVATTLEALVARICIALGGADIWRTGAGLRTRMVVNCLWTVAWFSFSLPFLSEAARQMHYWHVWPLPFSLINGLRGQGYLTWSSA